jgi:hypothetical protein
VQHHRAGEGCSGGALPAASDPYHGEGEALFFRSREVLKQRSEVGRAASWQTDVRMEALSDRVRMKEMEKDQKGKKIKHIFAL